MSVSLYDASVGTFLQILGATQRVLAKSRAYFEKEGVALDEVVGSRLIDDMLPLGFQIVSIVHHSQGAIQGVENGVFWVTPLDSADQPYPALEDLVARTRNALLDYSHETVNGLAGRHLEFRYGDKAVPFKAEAFLLTFSLPNFYFHATTAYDLLRMLGAPIGKRDFLGLS